MFIDVFIQFKLEVGRYRYLESVSVFGIGISEILVENSKFLVYPTSIWRPVGISQSAWKTRMMGPPGDDKV